MRKKLYKTLFVAIKIAIDLIGLVLTVLVKVFVSVTFMEIRRRGLLYLKSTSTLCNSEGFWGIKLKTLVPKGLCCQFPSAPVSKKKDLCSKMSLNIEKKVQSIYLSIYLSSFSLMFCTVTMHFRSMLGVH